MTKRIVSFLAAAIAVFLFFSSFEETIERVEILPVNLPWVFPFVLLLGAIAVAPFINRHWWEKNFPVVSYSLGAIIVVYYAFFLDNLPKLLLTLYEYSSFISLVGSLFVVSGGILLRIRGKATPFENVVLLGIGAVLSNFLGTTGASMLLIRPYLRMNKYRIKPYHIVFFIFIVSNIGGALTPIGDPPLFLGYLKGVPFFWVVQRVWHIWALAVGVLLLLFYLFDTLQFRKIEAPVREQAEEPEEARISGKLNLLFLGVILTAVFINRPIIVREILMWSAAIASFYSTKPSIHKKNEFNFFPIKEVAILFAGIFATMIPALDWLELNSRALGIETPGQYYWGTGILSSFLDNTPTYLNFLSAAFGLFGLNVDNASHMTQFLENHWKYLQSISISAVFFGAITYIGNAPNFMVKSISEHAKVSCPSFIGYMVKYSIPILIPLFMVVWYLFFRV